MKILNVNGAVLNEHSLNYLEEILIERKVEQHLVLANCKRTVNASLTSEDYERLKKAEKQGAKFFRKNVEIDWFTYIGQIEVKHFTGVELFYNNTLEYFFNHKTGKKDSLSREVVRLNTREAWQLLKSGSKRKGARGTSQDEATGKRQKTVLESEVDAVTNILEKKFKEASNSPDNRADKEIDGKVENGQNPSQKRCFESSPTQSASRQLMPPPRSRERVSELNDSNLNRPGIDGRRRGSSSSLASGISSASQHSSIHLNNSFPTGRAANVTPTNVPPTPSFRNDIERNFASNLQRHHVEHPIQLPHPQLQNIGGVAPGYAQDRNDHASTSTLSPGISFAPQARLAPVQNPYVTGYNPFSSIYRTYSLPVLVPPWSPTIPMDTYVPNTSQRVVQQIVHQNVNANTVNYENTPFGEGFSNRTQQPNIAPTHTEDPSLVNRTARPQSTCQPHAQEQRAPESDNVGAHSPNPRHDSVFN